MISSLPSARIGGALKRWRQMNGVKQDALAAEFGVSQGTVSRWEQGAAPSRAHAAKLTQMLAARPDSAADRALCRLIETSNDPYFLVCDVTHALLAASPQRAREWKVPTQQLMGQSLYRFATPEIVAFEESLAARGWFDTFAPVLVFRTSRSDHPELVIYEGYREVTKVQLSDGRYARLVSDRAGHPGA